MTQLLALSVDMSVAPSLRLTPVPADGQHPPLSWGLAWYPAGDAAAAVLKDPDSYGETPLTKLVSEWRRFNAHVFVFHLLGASKRRTQQDTHPFARSHAGRTWLMAHNGKLKDLANNLPLGAQPVFEPNGKTDSEHAFCWLLTRIRVAGARSLADVGWEQLHGWFQQVNQAGTANIILTDGHDVVVYRDSTGFGSLHWLRRRPPHAQTGFEHASFRFDLDDATDQNRTLVAFATTPLSDEPWAPLEPGQLVVARRAAIQWSSSPLATPSERPAAAASAALPPVPVRTQPSDSTPPETTPPQQTQVPVLVMSQQAPAPPKAAKGSRTLLLTHITHYKYGEPVEQSSHMFRLRPAHDMRQELLSHELVITPGGLRKDFEDVFGNQATTLEVDQPYGEMRIESRAAVRVHAAPPLTENSPHQRLTIPLVWMPWQREMMQPYLLPPELPESQLRELSAYAMSFVERQDYDLVETLLDINETLYRDYVYTPNSTTLETSAFDVYSRRRGVCQDFANLLICLARLLSVPARYQVGYIYTGASYENKIQSEASHAWAELYLPWLGWCGFDPTNGCLTGLDHVRVARGRNYRDATPSAGTIYRGGSGETLSVEVRVEELAPEASEQSGEATPLPK